MKKFLFFFALYFIEGAPIGLLWWTLPTLMRMQGVPLSRITTITSMLALPWALKFLWAPLLDLFRGKLGGYKVWILVAQPLMALTLLPLVWLDLNAQFQVLYPLLLLHSMAAATHDVAIDAAAINSVSRDARGRLNGWMQTGLLTGRSVFGGAAIFVSERFGLGPVVYSLCFILFLLWLFVLRSNGIAGPSFVPEKMGQPVAEFLTYLKRSIFRRSMLWAFVYAGIAGAGFEAAAGVMGPFLTDFGWSAAEVSFFLSVAAIICMILGSLLGGLFSDRFGRKWTVILFQLLLTASVILLAVMPKGITLVFFYTNIGLFIAASYAWMMSLTNAKFAATQFSALMGMTNFCESWSVFMVGALNSSIGYSYSFMTMAILSLIAIPILIQISPNSKKAD